MTQFSIKRRQLLAGIAAFSALPAVGLSSTSVFAQAAAPVAGGILKISHSTRVASLCIMQTSGAAEYLIGDMLYSGLTRMGMDMAPMPDLATEWSADTEAKVFTFKLRPGVTFHDGSPFTSKDVVATYQAILKPETASPARSVLNGIADIAAPDELTVVITLKNSYADFPLALTHPNARIFSAKALAGPIEALATQANGTGPFKQKTYDSARLTTLVKNEAYYADKKPYLDGVELHYFPDLAAETSNYLSGATDAMLEVQQADFARIAAAKGSKGQRVPSGRFVNIVMRADQKPFDDIRVRQAMAMAVDRQTLVDIVLEGLGVPAADTNISKQYRFFADVPETTYDPVASKKLLAEAGYPNGIKIPLVCSNRPAIRSQVGIAVKEMAAAAGFDIEVQTIPHDTYLANVWRKGNFYVGYWGMQTNEDAALTLLFTSDAAFADTAWNNKTFDGLVAKGRTELDPEKRKAIYAEAQQLMAKEKPSVLPMFQDVLTASRDVVQNWTCHPMSKNFYVEDVWLKRA